MRQLLLMPPQRVVQAVPVEVRIIEMELDAVTLTSIGEFLEHIAAIGSRIYNVVVACRGLEHREAIVVA